MNKLDLDYQNLLKDILENGTLKQTRNGSTISVFGRQIRHKMSEGFPLLTTKKIPFKTMVTELIWFLRGDTNIKYLVDNNCHIWDGDAYKNYERRWETEGKFLSPPVNKFTKEELINEIKTNPMVAKELGELGPIYGKQWRSWKFTDKFTNGQQIAYVSGNVDQIANLINELKTNPDSRRLMVNAWNVGELDQMVLPPCHYGFQVYTRELSIEERLKLVKNNVMGFDELSKATYDEFFERNHIPKRAISLMFNMRSVDTFLGLPFNIASYGLLLEIIAKEVNMVPDELIGNLGDVHLYSNHVEQAKGQIGRELTLEERFKYWFDNDKPNRDVVDGFDELTIPEQIHFLDMRDIPTRTREPYPLPKLWINNLRSDSNSIINDVIKWSSEDFGLENYQSHPTIKAPLSN
jgi:thymidylate synthase